MVGQIFGKMMEGIEHDPTLNLRRCRSRLLVYRHDPPRVHRLPFFIVDHFVLRIRELKSALRAKLHLPEADDMLTG